MSKTTVQPLEPALQSFISAVVKGEKERAQKRFAVINPATGAVIAHVADMTAEDTRAAIERAQKAFPQWRGLTAKQRAAILMNWREAIIDNVEALAALLHAEQGKPVKEARAEIIFGADYIEWFAEEGKRAYGDIIPANAPDRRLLVLKQPVGVTAAITPWNFPNAMITRKVSPALAAGCPIILKPAEDTPLSALALHRLAIEAGIPEDVFSVITASKAEEVAGELCGNPLVRKLSFTGSTRVGKILMRQCADTVKKLSLELGGNAPFIVFEDADIDAAVTGAVMSKFRNAGQTCVSMNRLYVHASLKDAFVEKFLAAISKLQVGPSDDDYDLGPLVNERAVSKVEQLVASAIEDGARILTGGARSEEAGLFYQPTVLDKVTQSARITKEEIFGPVAPVISFEMEEEVIAAANDTNYGLAAYFWTRDLNRVWRVAEALDYGMVGINEGVISSEAAPFGGVKESGIGREGSRYGLDEFLELKYAAMGRVH